MFDRIVLEVKAQSFVIEENYKQVINYLAASKMKIGLLINFGEDSLKFKRVVL
jgi:GxxExxY protein